MVRALLALAIACAAALACHSHESSETLATAKAASSPSAITSPSPAPSSSERGGCFDPFDPSAARRGPQGDAKLGGVRVRGGKLPGATRVVESMQRAFRNCYQRALAEDVDLAGTLQVSLDVDANGSVVASSASSTKLKSEDRRLGDNTKTRLCSCVEARTREAQFDAPGSNGAHVSFDVSLTQTQPGTR